MDHEPVIIIILVKTVIDCSFAVMKAVGMCECVCGNGCSAPGGCSNVISFSGD